MINTPAPQAPLNDQEALEAIADYDHHLFELLEEKGLAHADMLRVVAAIERRHGIRN